MVQRNSRTTHSINMGEYVWLSASAKRSNFERLFSANQVLLTIEILGSVLGFVSARILGHWDTGGPVGVLDRRVTLIVGPTLARFRSKT